MIGQLGNTTMIKYKQSRDLKGYTMANAIPPVLPDFAEGDPKVGEHVYRFFGLSGQFLGWCNYETGRKFLMGKLYYKTKGAYCMRSQRIRSATDGTKQGHKIFIREKDTGSLALYAVDRLIAAKDLIDSEDKESLAKISIEVIQAFDMNHWNYESFPDQYKLIPATMRQKFRDDMKNFLYSKKNELIAHLQDIANSYVAQRQHVDTHGVELAHL